MWSVIRKDADRRRKLKEEADKVVAEVEKEKKKSKS